MRSGTRDGVPTKTATARRTYATDQADLWEALTSTERLPRWFLPVSGDLRAAGTLLELVHEAPVDPGTWERFGPGAVGVGWPTTPEGTAFVHRAAERTVEFCTVVPEGAAGA
ncbi:hypothetical protein [Kineococcus sp. SYSU DK006]|uniref:hypothetical protein n=1 Tax=Kineococcus sp. SYSU DK006 TaxID=3383127 RepID=UPI003D7CEECD